MAAAIIWIIAAQLSQAFSFSDLSISIFWPPDGIAAGLAIAYGPRILIPLGAAIWLWDVARGMAPILATLGVVTLILALWISCKLMERERQQITPLRSPLAAMFRYHAITILPAAVILGLIGSWQFTPTPGTKPTPDIILVMAVSETLGILFFARLAELTAQAVESVLAAPRTIAAQLRRRSAVRLAWLGGLLLLACVIYLADLPASFWREIASARYLVFIPIIWASYRGRAYFVHLVTALSAIILLTLTPDDIRGDAWLLPDQALLLSSVAFLGFMASATMEYRRQIEDKLRNMAHRDPLTGWLNESGLATVLAAPQRQGSLIGIDLQTLRHTMELIGLTPTHQIEKDLAGLIEHDLQQVQAFARPRESFFVILLPEKVNAYTYLPRLGTLLNQRQSHGPHSVRIQASVGVLPLAGRPREESVADILATLMVSCQLAAFRQEHALAYDPQTLSSEHHALDNMIRTRRDQLSLLEELKEALRHDPGAPNKPGLWLACQRIQSSTNPQKAGIEVLLRWTLQDGTQQMPDGFLPMAERYGLMPQVDRWVLTHTLKTIAAFDESAAVLHKVSINLSGSSLASPQLYDFIKRALNASDLSPSRFCLEITETAGIVQREPAIALLSRLRSLGLHTSLDDFGTGLASFDYLMSLPLDYVKIDGRFVRDLETNPVSLSIVAAICSVARAMNLKTVAEFVETAEQRAILNDCGVDYLQGYGISKPVFLVRYLEALSTDLPASLAVDGP